MSLKISISGIRGIYGESLNEEMVEGFAKAFACYTNGGKIVIGTDNRDSKDILKKAAIAGLLSRGCEIIDIGIVPTPTVQIVVRKFKAKGGIVITASHNPAPWNGMKFIRKDGIFLNEAQANRLIKIYHAGISGNPQNRKSGIVKERKDVLDIHINKVLENIDVKLIKEKKFKIALDTCQGAGKEITPRLLKKLNCEVILVETRRGFEPVPANLAALCKAVKKHKCDLGFAQDPDADRLALVSDQGIAVGEEYSVALAADFILSASPRSPNPIVVNLSTSRMVDDIAKKHGTKVIRTKIGEVNVAEKMKEIKSPIGGEGNGGVIYPRVGYGRDSLAGIGLILNYLAKSGKTISNLVAEIPKYTMYKGKIEVNPEQAMEKVKKLFKDKEINLADGVKIIDRDYWIHLRPSNTEPIVRLIIEAKHKDKIAELRKLLS